MGKLHAVSTSEKWLGARGWAGDTEEKGEQCSKEERKQRPRGNMWAVVESAVKPAGRTHTGEVHQESSARCGWGGRCKNPKNKGRSGKAAAPRAMPEEESMDRPEMREMSQGS